jgi:hypothetical protein
MRVDVKAFNREREKKPMMNEPVMLIKRSRKETARRRAKESSRQGKTQARADCSTDGHRKIPRQGFHFIVPFPKSFIG